MNIQGIVYVVTWVSEPTACARCLALNGKEWTVHDVDEVPLIHEMSSHPHCRCTVDVEIDVNLEEFQLW
jgi:hypothetical protein